MSILSQRSHVILICSAVLGLGLLWIPRPSEAGEGEQGFADNVAVSRIPLAANVTLTADDVTTAGDIEAAILAATNNGTQRGTVTLDGREGPFAYAPDGDRSINLFVSDLALRGTNEATIANCDDGVFFAGGVDVARVAIEDIDFMCTGNGIREGAPIGRKDRIIVSNNSFIAELNGVILSRLRHSRITRNQVVVQGRGIVVADGSEQSAILLNDIEGSRGVDILNASGLLVALNRILAREIGILVRGTSSENRILANRIEADDRAVFLGPETSENRVIANRSSSAEKIEIEDQGSENIVRKNR